MEFKIIDETAYGLYQDMDFESVTRWDKNHWKCETTNGFFLNIKIKGGTLYADLAETEYQLGYNAVPLIKYKYNDLDEWEDIIDNKIDFNKIKKFMKWTCPSENLWDIV